MNRYGGAVHFLCSNNNAEIGMKQFKMYVLVQHTHGVALHVIQI